MSKFLIPFIMWMWNHGENRKIIGKCFVCAAGSGISLFSYFYFSCSHILDENIFTIPEADGGYERYRGWFCLFK